MGTYVLDIEPGFDHGVMSDGDDKYLVVVINREGTKMTVTPVMGPFTSFGAAFAVAQEMG